MKFNDDSKKYSTISILLSVFGIGTYRQESKRRYDETMKKADWCIKESKVALVESEKILTKINSIPKSYAELDSKEFKSAIREGEELEKRPFCSR